MTEEALIERFQIGTGRLRGEGVSVPIMVLNGINIQD